MPDPLASSIQHCCEMSRRTGRNFYWSFLTLPRAMRRDMCVLYAFMRVTDDLGDEGEATPHERRTALREWREELLHAVGTGEWSQQGEGEVAFSTDRQRVLPALTELVHRRGIEPQWLCDVIDGVESDLLPREFRTFEQLQQYCYQVAGAVGLCCIQVWGYHGVEARSHAIDCGTAFQLTNILRDLGEDANRGRLYLPREDLDRFHCSQEDLTLGRGAAYQQLMQFQTARAREFYGRGSELLPCLDRPGQRVLSAMFRIYSGLLDEIEHREFDVFTRRVELTRLRKLRAAVTSWIRPTTGQ